MRLESPDDVDWRRGLFEIGMDSLMALELKNRLQSGLRRPDPVNACRLRPPHGECDRTLPGRGHVSGRSGGACRGPAGLHGRARGGGCHRGGTGARRSRDRTAARAKVGQPLRGRSVSHSTEPQDGLSPLQRAYVKIVESEARLDQAERRRREPIAIIGMACRFPGGVANPRGYWELLANGRNAITEIPRERWDVDALYSPDPQAPGKMCTPVGRLPRRVDRFDAEFFGITPREAIGMDPQQRLLLEVAGRRSSDAGSRRDAWPGSRPACSSAPARRLRAISYAGPDGLIDAYTVSGNPAHASCAGRISYCLGLQGPSWPSTRRVPRRWWRCTWPARACARGVRPRPRRAGSTLLLAPEMHHLAVEGGRCCRRTAAARRSTLAPTASCAARDAAWWCLSG